MPIPFLALNIRPIARRVAGALGPGMDRGNVDGTTGDCKHGYRGSERTNAATVATGLSARRGRSFPPRPRILLVFAGVVGSSAWSSCNPSCPPFGGSSNGTAPSCNDPCPISTGPAPPLGPPQMLFGSFVLDALGIFLLGVAARRAWITARELRDSRGTGLPS